MPPLIAVRSPRIVSTRVTVAGLFGPDFGTTLISEMSFRVVTG